MTYPEFLQSWRSDSRHIACHTSGSTGAPKQILLPKHEMERSARRTLDFLKIKPGSIFYSCISPDYIGGKMQAVRAEISSGNLRWETPSNKPYLNVSEGEIDLLSIVPSQIISIIDRLDAGEKLPNLKNILIGGSSIHPSLRTRIARTGLNCFESYGMTETCSHIALRKITEIEEFFTPLPGITVELDSNSRLMINIENWQVIHTNDLAILDDKGNFKILGRFDNVIVTGGKKVSPEQYEEILEAELGFPILFTGEPDEKWTHCVVLTADGDQNNETIDLILNACRRLMPDYAVPKRIRFGKIPLTPNGKKLRR
ncbi:MAG: AMP-binding protein [Muribaculaceae bacterium]|nr:AMP-binding protein [Muribaculaceae bacterium]